MGVGGHRTHSLMAKYTGGRQQPWHLHSHGPWYGGHEGGGRQQPWHLHSHGPWYGGHGGGTSAALTSPQPWTLVWRARGGDVSSPDISTAMDPGMEGTGGGRQQPWPLHSHGPWYGGHGGGASAALASPQPWTLVWRARGGDVSSPGISTAMDPGMEGTGRGVSSPGISTAMDPGMEGTGGGDVSSPGISTAMDPGMEGTGGGTSAALASPQPWTLVWRALQTKYCCQTNPYNAGC